MFENVLGQDKVKEYFTRAFDSGKVPKSIIFYGPVGVGKAAAALELAKRLTCHAESKPCGECVSCKKFRKMEHPDVQLYFPAQATKLESQKGEEEIQAMRASIAENPYSLLKSEKNASLTIGMVRRIKQHLRMQAYQGHGRVIILLGCDSLNQETGNALLKVLEEPPDDTTFILTTSNIDNVLPTIKSRCQIVPFTYLAHKIIAAELVQKYNVTEKQAEFLATLSGGSFSFILDYIHEDFDEQKQICSELFEAVSVKPAYDSIIFVEEWLSKKPSVNEVKGIFFLVVSLLKMQYESSPGGEEMKKSENTSELPSILVEKLNRERLESTVVEIEKAIDLLHKNVYLNAILLILILRLRKIFDNEQ